MYLSEKAQQKREKLFASKSLRELFRMCHKNIEKLAAKN